MSCADDVSRRKIATRDRSNHPTRGHRSPLSRTACLKRSEGTASEGENPSMRRSIGARARIIVPVRRIERSECGITRASGRNTGATISKHASRAGNAESLPVLTTWLVVRAPGAVQASRANTTLEPQVIT